MPKIKIIALAVMLTFATYAKAETIPYTLTLKYVNEATNIETLITDENNQQYIPRADVEKLYGKQFSVKSMKIDGVDSILVSDIGALEVDNNSLKATLLLLPKYLPEQNYSLNNTQTMTRRAPEAGQYFNYDFSADSGSNFKSVEISHNFSTASGNNGQVDVNWNNVSGPSLVNAFYNIRDDERNRVFKIGTGYSVSTELSNSVRYLGFQVQSNYDIDPNYNDRVSGVFTGTAEIAGTAELYLNGSKILQQAVRPGDFKFDGIYNPFTTAGQAELVIKDINGRVLTVNKPLIGSPRNLRQGVSNYSFETGMLRNTYNALGASFASGTYNYGLTNALTLGTHAEVSTERANLSASAILATNYGTFKTGASIGAGTALNLGYLVSTKELYANVDYTKFMSYQGIGAIEKRNEGRLLVTTSYRLTNSQSLLGTYIRSGKDTIASLGTSWNLGDRVKLMTTISKESNHSASFYAGLDIPLGRSRSYSSYESKNKSLISEFSTGTNKLNEIEYLGRVQKTQGSTFMNGNVNLPTQYGDISLAMAKSTTTSASLSANGSVVISNGSLNLSRKIYDSYFITDVSNPDININSNSGYKGKTGNNGRLVFPTSSNGDTTLYLNPQEFRDDRTPLETKLIISAYPKSPSYVKVKIAQPGFYLKLDTLRPVVKIEGADFYKVDEGFYIDGLSAGIHEFSLDGKNYSFDSSIVNSDNIVVANIK